MADASSYFTPQYNSNMPTNAGQVTQLPYNTQYALDTAMMKKALAQALLARGMQQRQGETIVTGGGAPNRFVKSSPLQGLADVASTILGSKMLGGSMSDMSHAMQDYQTRLAANQQSTADILLGRQPQSAGGGGGQDAGPVAQSYPVGPSGSPNMAPPLSQGPAPAAPTGAAAGPITSDRVLQAYTGMKTSGIPAQMADADKLIPAYTALADKEKELAWQQKKDAFEQLAKRSTRSSVAAAVHHGYDESLLVPIPPQVEGGPEQGTLVDDTHGIMSTQQGSTGELTVQESPAAKTARMQSEKRMGLIDQRVQEFGKERDDVVSAARGAAAAQAFLKVLPYTRSGPGALDRNTLDKLGQILGLSDPLPSNTTATDIANNLALTFRAAARTSSGLAQIRNAQEWKQISDTANLNVSNPALESIARNVIIEAAAARASYARRLELLQRAAVHEKYSAGQLDDLPILDTDIPKLDVPPQFLPASSSPAAASAEHTSAPRVRPPIDTNYLRQHFPSG